MTELSTLRLYVMRTTYLIIFTGLAITIWPLLVNAPTDLPLMKGVVRSVLTAVSLLAVLGIRYPVKMLPLMFFELIWKTIWVVGFGLPLWRSGQMDAETGETMKACLMGAIFLVAIPWGFVWRNYVTAPSDRWGSDRRLSSSDSQESAS
ncbi:MAG: hypothetical protein ABI625_22930 [bacterium]